MGEIDPADIAGRQNQRASIRVLQVHHFRYPETKGGVDRVVSDMVDALGIEQCTLFEVAGWDERKLMCRDAGGLRIYRGHLRRPGSGRGFLGRGYAWLEMVVRLGQLARIIRQNSIDLVHLHTLQDYQWYFAVLARFGMCRYVVTLHRAETLEYPKRCKSQQAKWEKVLRQAARITAVSETLAQVALQNLPIGSKPAVVYNGITDPGGTLADRQEHEKQSYAVCVGALEPYKGIDIAIDAWEHLSTGGIGLHLFVAGGGSLENYLLQKVRNQESAKYIHLLGALPYHRVLQIVSDAEIFIMPSRNEGFGLALVEAAALGRPIVASDIPVFREIITNGENGLLFRPEDPHALADQVSRLVNDPEYAECLGAAARKRYLTAFSKERMLAGYDEVYRRVLHKDRR